jgi:stearoyl-CoA desaturase (Delta-9 desaturase)
LLLIGLAAAAAASVAYNVGIVLQALDAREAPAEEGLRLSLLARLLRRRRWVAGFLLGGVGFGLQVLALDQAPFVVVQPVLAAGLVLVLWLGVRVLAERVGGWELAGVVGIVGGIALLAWGAPAHTEHVRSTAAVVAVTAGLGVLALLPFALRGGRFDTTMLVIVASALAFGAGNIATKLVSDELGGGRYLFAAVWLGVAAATGVAAIVTEMTALQRGRATMVVPVSLAVQTFVPVLLEPIYLSERWSTAAWSGVPLIGGLVLVALGTLAVARTRAVSALLGGGVDGEKPAAADLRPPAPAPAVADVRPVTHPAMDRVASGVVTALPPALIVAAAWVGWGSALYWQDLVVLTVTYLLFGFGITVGFHRLLTHRSFQTSRALRAIFAALGSAAVEGPVIEWVATHRKHHTFSDVEGDPHSPHVDHGAGWRGALGGLFHAHIGWVFRDAEVADERRYARDLLEEPALRFVDRSFVAWVVLGLAFSFGLGMALTGSVAGGLTGLLWGGAVRIFLLHHATFSINSLCHFFGRRPFATGDESRNLAWLALPTMGESWHNNHHAFPTSARHGLERWQFDGSAVVIRVLELTGLAWDVVRVPPARSARKAAGQLS